MSENDRKVVSVSRAELLADGIVHIAGLSFAASACLVLIAIAHRQGDPLRDIGLAIYGVGLVSMFAFSALNNLVGRIAWKEILRRLDHAAIFVMIAGTYSPLVLTSVGNSPGREMFAFVWSVAIFGVGAKLFIPSRFERFSIAVYLLLGWCILANPSLIQAMPASAIVLLLAGGLLYSFGVVFHLWTRLPYQNAIWHLFVLAGAGCHYAAIARTVTAA